MNIPTLDPRVMTELYEAVRNNRNKENQTESYKLETADILLTLALANDRVQRKLRELRTETERLQKLGRDLVPGWTLEL